MNVNQASRTMSSNQVQVIGAGWGRTGTSSFKKALEILGYNPTYHMVEVIENNHVRFWQRMFDGEKCDFEEIFNGEKRKYSATCDFPSAYFWKEQLEQYPNAVVILTARDPEKWFKSCSQTIFRVNFNSPFVSIWTKISLWLGLPQPGFGRMVSKIFDVSFGGSWEKDKIIAAYNAHNDRVKKECPSEKLLIFDVAEGWETLCKFLNKPIPNVPFPHVNDTKEFQRIITSMEIVGYVATAAAVVIPSIGGYFLAKHFGHI